ncbi:MAG TPA: dTDP-4-dehydrorhamnose 3,5-epimerase [Cyclobacteriaceae bacterium]|nr:dTDP-4-dehydrorhamnose 3,5-epimerase [Cyclobacteriaceae bacterium]
MKLTPTEFDGLFILEPKVIEDERGYFMESYSQRTLQEIGLKIDFVQDNQSKSKKGVLRGLHFQNAPYSQTKLIRVLSGSVLDIVVDLRREKSTFARYFKLELTAENKKQLLVPKGFAHGFLVLSEYAEVFYKTDEFYNREADGGINFNDPSLGLTDIFLGENLTLSEKDKKLPLLAETNFNF